MSRVILSDHAAQAMSTGNHSDVLLLLNFYADLCATLKSFQLIAHVKKDPLLSYSEPYCLFLQTDKDSTSDEAPTGKSIITSLADSLQPMLSKPSLIYNPWSIYPFITVILCFFHRDHERHLLGPV